MVSSIQKHNCFACGCRVQIPIRNYFCGPHYRLIPISTRRLLRHLPKLALKKAIKVIAEKEGKMALFNELEMAASR